MYSSLTIFFTVFLSTTAVSTTTNALTAAHRPTSTSTCPDGSQPVQCFVNPCITATCSAHPNAVCRPNYCGGCNAQFFNPLTGGQVTCNNENGNGPVTTTTPAPGTCPDGSSPFECFVDPCRFGSCPAFPNAVCRANYCGGCNAEFFNSDGRKVTCNAPAVTTTPAPPALPAPAGGICPDGSSPFECLVDPCRFGSCPAFPNAVCRANYCGGCNAEFFNSDGRKVTCNAPAAVTTTPAPPRGTCPDGSSPFNCFVDPCRFATCPASPNAVCRSNYCGGCNAEWFNSVGRKVITCDATVTTGAPAPAPAPGTCPDGTRPVQCFVDPCRTATCPAFPNAVCRANYCGGCNADFYNNNGVKVDCARGLPDNCPVLRCMGCPAGQSHTKDARGCDTCTCGLNGGGGSGGVITTTTPKPLCGPVCDIYCPSGNVLDNQGCPTCRCKPTTTTTTTTTTTPQTTSKPPVCGPVCDIYCPSGNVLDANGCATCRCKPSPTTTTTPTTRPTRTVCGPVCAIFCPNGHVLDANGCPTCRCKPASIA